MDFQRRLYYSRLQEYSAKKASAEENVSQSESELLIATTTRDKYLASFDIAKEKETRIQQLVEQNAVALFVLLDHRAKLIEDRRQVQSLSEELKKAEEKTDFRSLCAD